MVVHLISKLTNYFRSRNPDSNPITPAASSEEPLKLSEYHITDNYQSLRFFDHSSEGDLTLLRSQRTGKLLVVKHTKARPTFKPNDGLVYRVPDEAKTLLHYLPGAADHGNIITMFAAETSWEPGRCLLMMEYCSGGDLMDQYRRFTTMTPRDYEESRHLLVHGRRGRCYSPKGVAACLVPEMFLLHVFHSLVQALAFVHDEGEHEAVVHGDVKLENVLLRFPGRSGCGMPDVVLADFGASQLAWKSRGISGTPGYDAPEVLGVSMLEKEDPGLYRRKLGECIVTPKSDVYQLGHVIYFLAAGELWETGAHPDDLMLPEEYTTIHCRHLTTVLALCFRVKPSTRPSAKELSLYVEGFREQRDLLYRERGALPSACWATESHVPDI